MAKQNNKTPSGYKSSPIGLIPKDWEIGELRKLTSKVGSGITPSGGQKVYKSSGIPFLRSQNVGWGNFILDDVAFIDEQMHNTFVSTEIRKKDVLLNITGASIGRSAVATDEIVGGNVNQHVCILRTNPELLDPYYLNAYLLSPIGQKTIDSYQAGGNREGLNFEQIKSFKIPLPQIKEQTIITDLIRTWDKAIKNTTQLITQKEQRKKWLMQQLLTGKKRLKGFEKEKWKVCTLGDLFERVTKKNTERNQTVVTISAQRGFVMQNDYFNKIIASDILDNYFLVEKGEFCYNKSYSNGYPWGATKRLNDFEKAVVTTLYICFKIKDTNKTSGDYFEHFFEVNSLDKGLMSVANEGGRAHGLLNVTATDFFNIEIKVPKVEEQEAIAKILSLSVNEIHLLQNKLNHLKEQKKGLMQVLLTGKKRLKIK